MHTTIIIIVVKNRPPHVKNPGYAPVHLSHYIRKISSTLPTPSKLNIPSFPIKKKKSSNFPFPICSLSFQFKVRKKYEFNKQSLDSGGNERPRDLQVGQCTNVTATACQEQCGIIFSGQEALYSVFFCYI